MLLLDTLYRRVGKMPHIFNNQKRSIPHARRLISLSTVSLVVLIIVSTCFALTHTTRGKMVRAAGTSFTFTAVGDYAQTNHTTANLKQIAQSGANFDLALGDFSYSSAVTADQWSTYVKGYLPANFPLEIIPGDHDVSQLSLYATDLPDYMASTGTYAQQYYFDYPGTSPLARFIMLSPSEISGYNYTKGGSGYRWVSSTIDAARAANIPWVIVGMYKNCFSLGSAHCSHNDLMDLLVSKKVDLILYAHKHNYEASKQLALNTTTCPSLTTVSYNANCVVPNATTTMTKGAGSVIVIAGTGGASMNGINSTDPALGYFRAWEASNIQQTWGFSQFTVSATQITMKFVGTSGGTFVDSFTLHA